jgi:hypothetical protein
MSEFVQVGGSWYPADAVTDVVARVVYALGAHIHDCDKRIERARSSRPVATARADENGRGKFIAWAGGKRFTDPAEFNRFLDSGAPLWQANRGPMDRIAKIATAAADSDGVRPVMFMEIGKALKENMIRNVQGMESTLSKHRATMRVKERR